MPTICQDIAGQADSACHQLAACAIELVHWSGKLECMHAGDAEADLEAEVPANDESAALRSKRQDELNRNTSLIMQRAIAEANGLHDSGAPGLLLTPRQLLAEAADICRRANAAFARMIDDRTRGRFFTPDVIDAARMEEVDSGYTSDEDTIAVYCEYDNGSHGVEVALAERLLKGKTAGSKTPHDTVNQLSTNDPCGIVRVRWFQPKLSGRGRKRVFERHEHERIYVLSLQPKEGLNQLVTCAEVIHGVHMKWHEQHKFYTLSQDDERALAEWLEHVHAAGSHEGVPLANRPSRSTKRAQKAQRKPGLGR